MNSAFNSRMAKLCLSAAGVAAVALVAPALMVRADTPPTQTLPAPDLTAAAGGETSSGPGLQTAIFAGGCFWGIQGVFEHVKGVTQAVSGYSGGHVANPSYQQVSAGTTGHAESVRVTYDPAQVSYAKLLQIFFTVGLDPTQVDRQGPDWGTQYRSELFVSGPEQTKVAQAYIGQLTIGHSYTKPIATKVEPAGAFYPAESYHQDYLERNPNNGYIAMNDIPKVQALQRLFPENWLTVPVTVATLASTGG